MYWYLKKNKKSPIAASGFNMKITEKGVYVRVDVFLQSTLARCKNIYFDFHWICTKDISSVPHGNIADVTYKWIPLDCKLQMTATEN